MGRQPCYRVPQPVTEFEQLTPRQQQIARLLAEGLSNPEIAADLGIRLNTVKQHLNHLIDRCGLQRGAKGSFRPRVLIARMVWDYNRRMEGMP